MINYTPVAQSFLSERFPKGALHFQQITAADITAFVQRQSALVTSNRAPLVVTALRSFLRYLFLRGIVATDLATCVPTIATWSLSNVPRFLAGEQIQKILASCDKETGIGKRDYALLLLLARLGLRAGEVVSLTLDDLDWEAGLVTVRGKGKRVAQMPLPSEVGAAIADYLSTGRPQCSSRRVFIRGKAPLAGFANSVAICSLVDRALGAGVESEYRGSHVFRHSLATGMLNHGASLDEIGDLLRHRRPDTLESTPKWIWYRFVPSRFDGQEAADEAFATSHRRLHRAPAQLGIQAAAHGRGSSGVWNIPGAKGSTVRDHGTGYGMGDGAYASPAQ